MKIIRGNKNGISTYLAVLILIILVIAAGLLIWLYTIGYIGGGASNLPTGRRAMLIQSVAQGGGQIFVYVKNFGTGSVKLDRTSNARVYVEDARVDYLISEPEYQQELPEGKVCTVEFPAQSLWFRKTVKIKVIADDGTFAEVSTKIAAPTIITIQATAGQGGDISPKGVIEVPYGSDQRFAWTPDPHYYVSALTVDGAPITPIPMDYAFTAVTEGHTIDVQFHITEYTITASAGAGGSISPSDVVIVSDGADQAFTITPNTGYHVSDVLVDGGSVGAVTGYTFTSVTASHTIVASFAINTYTITVTQSAHGTIAPGTTVVNYDGGQAFTITPDQGYYIFEVIVDSISQGVRTSYTFTNVITDHTISATFNAGQAPVTHTITALAGAGGSINPSGAVIVNHGANQAFTITPDQGYYIVDVVVDSVSQGVRTSYTFTNVVGDHTISVTFAQGQAPVTHTITASAGAGGSINPSGAVIVNHGANQAFAITADDGYHVFDVVVDGTQHLGEVSFYSFTNVIADHVILATFVPESQITYTITASAGSGGSISPSGIVTVVQGASQTFTITADSGYQVADVVVDGDSQGPMGSYTFSNVHASHSISAYFAPYTGILYRIIASAGPGGSISPLGTVTVDAGATQVFRITPDAGYEIFDVVVDGTQHMGAVSSYAFTNVNADHDITATFTQSVYSLTVIVNPTAGGSVTANIPPPYYYGNVVTLTETPNSGYTFSGWSGDGTGSGTARTVTMDADKTVTATFIASPATKLVYIAGASQSLLVNQISSVITVQRQDVSSNPYTVGTITVNLARSGSTGTFYSDAAGTNPITSIQIIDGSSSANFYYRDTASGTRTLTASSAGLTDATTQFTINNYKLVFTVGGGQSIATGARSSTITVQRQTQSGTGYTSGTITVTLTTTATFTGTFESSNGENIMSVTINNGQSFASFYYRDTVPGTPTLTASASSYAPAQTTFTITGGAIPNIASSFTPSHGIIPGSQVTDTAKLVSATSDASGTFTYYLYSGIYPSGNLIGQSTHQVTNGIVPNSNPFTVAQGPYYFITVYSGDSKNNGVTSSSPEAFVVWPLLRTVLLPPSADTSDNHLGIYPSSGSHYSKVNQASPDGDATYVYAQTMSYWTDDTYQIPNLSFSSGTINYVTIHEVSRTTGSGFAQLSLETHGQEYDGSEITGYDFPLTPDWLEYTAMWATNPYTHNQWTIQEVNDLMIGCSLYRANGDARCTQVYVEVYFTP